MNRPGMNPERLGDILWSRGIEGIVIAPLVGHVLGRSDRQLRLDFSRFAVVEISETVESPKLNRAIHDQYTAMLRCLEELARLNYRTIGLVLQYELDLRVNGKWTAAYLRYRQQTGSKSMPPPLILPATRQADFDRWFDRHRPDAIISVDRFGLHFLKARGLRIPGQIGYATLDRDGDASAFPDVSGIDQNSHRVGAAAVDLLVATMHRGERGIPAHPVRMEVEGTWIAGSSTRRQRPHRA